jgi:osmotically inducible lipoprotein OsmB
MSGAAGDRHQVSMVNGLIGEVLHMNTIKKVAMHGATIAFVVGMTGCAGMSSQDKNTAVGAGAGAVLGAVLTGGSTVGTVGGAAVGGVIGNQVKR